jgi:excisionase family DNA binding protein
MVGVPEQEVWTADEVAAYLRVSVRTVTAAAGRGEIPGWCLGRLWRFQGSSIRALAGRRIGRSRPSSNGCGSPR